MKVDMAVNLKSISSTSVTLSYAYSDTALDTISSTSNIFECQRISPNATKYIYIVVTPTSTSIPSTFSSSVVFYQGVAGELSIIANGETLSTQTIVKGQLVNEPVIEIPEGYELVGWYLDEVYTISATFPIRIQGITLYAKIYNPHALPSDWLAYDSTTKSYYVKEGNSTLPSNLIIPSIYNDGVNGEANVTYISDNGSSDLGGVFYRQSANLISIELPSTITSIGYKAFYGCYELTSVDMSSCTSLTSIGGYAFYLCKTLSSITLPSGLTSIGEYCFGDCTGLTSIYLSTCTKLEKIGLNVFQNCSGLTNINLSKCTSLIIISSYSFYKCSKLTSITLPTNITSIGNNAFYSCSSLKSITIPSSVTSIGNSAFSSCSSLKSITIPSSVTSIGSSAFSGCSSLTSIDLSQCTNLKIIENRVFQSCTKLTNITISNSVISIGDNAFYACNSLNSITIPSSVTKIGYWAFGYCNSLTSVTFNETSTWFCTSSNSYTGGDRTNLTDSSANATYLKSTYGDRYWYKV